RTRRRCRPVRGPGRRHRPDVLSRRQRLVGGERPVLGPHRVPPVRPHQPGARRLVRRQGHGPDRWRVARPARRRTIPRRRVLRLAPGCGRGRVRLARHRRRPRAAGVRALRQGAAGALALATLLALAPLAAREDGRAPEPNTRVPTGMRHYVANVFPDRIVASPAQDATRGLSVAGRTGRAVDSPLLEIVEAGDSPDLGEPRRIRAGTRELRTENGTAHHHRVEVDGLQPDTLYAWRVQGGGTWSAWHHIRTAAAPGSPLTLLYFGDTQNKNVSLGTRVLREAMRHAPEARLALFAGDLVSGGDGEDDTEWGEWFEAAGALPTSMAVAPAAGNHEYFEEFEDTPRERRVLGSHWPVQFALPGNGAPGAERTSYWFDYQDERIAVLDGTSALDLDTARAQARWLDGVLAGNPQRWSIVMTHQPFYSPRAGRDNAALREHLLPVIRRRGVDLVLQGHDHVYGRRRDEGGRLPV